MSLLFTKKFVIEFCILIIHPLPFVEANYPIQMIDMFNTKSVYTNVDYYLGDF